MRAYPNQEWRLISEFLSHDERLEAMLAAAQSDAAPDWGSAALDDLVIRTRNSLHALARLAPSGIHIAVVFGMYKEMDRIGRRSDLNPFGENAILRKARSLDWLLSPAGIRWHLYAVDDDPGELTAAAAEEMIAGSEYADRISVICRERQSREAGGPPGGGQKSKKGGAILLGMKLAAEAGAEIVITTDCDNSVDLAQIGTHLVAFIEGELDVLCADRFRDDSAFYWHPFRTTLTDQSKLLVHIRRSLITQPLPVDDFMCPLKLYRADCVPALLQSVDTYDLDFELDLILSAIGQKMKVGANSVSFLDSYEHSFWSTAGDAELWFHRLRNIVRLARKHKFDHDEAYADIVERNFRSADDVHKVLSARPFARFVSVEDAKLGQPALAAPREIDAHLASLHVSA